MEASRPAKPIIMSDPPDHWRRHQVMRQFGPHLITGMQPDIPWLRNELPNTAEAAHNNRLDTVEDHQGRYSPASPGSS